MTSIAGRRLFLSASFPEGTRGEPYRPFDVGAISDAVVALTRAVLRAGARLAFGGHPTISPLVLLVAREMQAREQVEIYQSEFYKGRYAPETLELEAQQHGVIEEIPRHPSEIPEDSLKPMRERIFGNGPFVAGVFVGGMDGIDDEFDLLGARQEGVPRLPLWAPGGAARQLFDGQWEAAHPVEHRLKPQLRSPRYPRLARAIVAALEEDTAR